MRERERGTIEHLLVMPVRSSEIAAANIWANGLVILLAAAFSLHVVVHVALQVPIVGSVEVFLIGTAIYLFAVMSLGILLATVVNSMPQFALLSIPVFVLVGLLYAIREHATVSTTDYVRFSVYSFRTLCSICVVSRCRTRFGVEGLGCHDRVRSHFPRYQLNPI